MPLISYVYKLQDNLSHLIFIYLRLSIDDVNTVVASITPPLDPKKVPTLPVYVKISSSTAIAKVNTNKLFTIVITA